VIRLIRGVLIIFGLIIFSTTIAPAHAQEELPPPNGYGRVVILIGGQVTHTPYYRTVGNQIAQLGYDVVLFNHGPIVDTQGAGLRTDIQQALRMPHAAPGKVGLIGFSAGGGDVLRYGSQNSDIASVIIAWYPNTQWVAQEPDFVGSLRLPVLMLVGETDIYRGCCLASTARTLAAAAAAGRQVELATYPYVGHDFIAGGAHYDPQAYADAVQRTAAKLAQYLGR
jgi:dienelactone hydrolase